MISYDEWVKLIAKLSLASEDSQGQTNDTKSSELVGERTVLYHLKGKFQGFETENGDDNDDDTSKLFDTNDHPTKHW